MPRRKPLILLFATLVVGFGAALIIRPAIISSNPMMIANSPLPPVVAPAAPRGPQYFEVHIGEARRVVAECREGTIRGDECNNAEAAIITVESKERFQRFRTDQR